MKQKKQIVNLHKDLKLAGKMIKFVLPYYTKRKFAFINKFLNTFVKGRAFTKKINYHQQYIDRTDGTKLRLCVYTQKEPAPNAVGLLWLHGGGFAIGLPEEEIFFIETLATACNCVVVAPDYTNSMQKPFPAAINDCYSALLWLKNNSAQLGVDSSKLFVGGASAGGGLTAATCLLARDKGEVNIAFAMPLYPMLDDRPTATNQHNEAPMCDSRSCDLAWRLYLDKDFDTDNVSKYAAPARETNYKNLPPILTYVGDIEPFAAETATLVDNFNAEGIPTLFKVFEGCFHAFDAVVRGANVSKQAKDFLVDGFLHAVNNYSAKQKD